MYRLYTILLSILSSGMIMADSIPCINLTYAQLDKDTFNIGEFQLITNNDTTLLGMKIRHRGSSALFYDKPSYAIKLIDQQGNNVDTALLGMREDNYWILDAMACDKARMRNRVSMDLWLEMSHQPWYKEQEPKCINGYRGQMISVYVNGQHYGLYHLMERVDRKQLKLQKYSEKKGIRGVLYKSIHWGGTANFSAPTTVPSNTSSTWDGWELKYPDLEDGEPIKWEPLYDLISFVNFADSTTFADSIAYRLDLPVFIDYVLFCQLISARDNDVKNTYISFYDATYQRALYTPWDLDHSWGRQYDGREEETTENLFLGNNLFLRLNRDYPHFSTMLNNRWKELRQHLFTIEHIDSLFAPYFTLYTTTGFDTCEQRLWSGHNELYFDIASEQSYIHDWLSQRLCFLDTLYQYVYPYTAVESYPNSPTPYVKIMKNGQIYIVHNGHTYNIMGLTISKNNTP